MTTATKLTPAEVKARLEELLAAATDYAVAEDRIERLSVELREHEDDLVDGLDYFEPAVHAQVMAAVRPLDDDNRAALYLCQEIQEAIEILKFAMERDDAR